MRVCVVASPVVHILTVLIQRARHPIAEEQLNSVLSVYATSGDVVFADVFVSEYLDGESPVFCNIQF